jgi:hypothetical protein
MENKMSKGTKVATVLGVIAAAVLYGIIIYYAGKGNGYIEGRKTGIEEATAKYAGTLLPLEKGKVYLAVVAGIESTEEQIWKEGKVDQEPKYYRLRKYGISVGDKYLFDDSGIRRIITD